MTLSRSTDVVAYTVDHGGGTFEAGTLLPFEPTEGYAVAVAHGAVLHGLHSLREACRAVAGEWSTSFVGTWVRPDGAICVDPVTYVRDLEYALLIGRRSEQAAIWSFADHVAIEL